MNLTKISTFAAAALLAGSAGFTSCTSDKDELNPNVVVENGTVGVRPEFVISIPRSVVSTRMSADVTQSSGTYSQFRGLDKIRLVPFTTEPTTGTTKSADVMWLSSIGSLQKPGQLNYKRYASQFVPVGTKYFLLYAKAIDKVAEEDLTDMNDKFKYGVLTSANLDDSFTTPSAVDIGLERIVEGESAITSNTTGQAILSLLTSIANSTDGTQTWATTTNATLKALYDDFITMRTYSSSRVAIILSQLYYAASHVDDADPAHNLSLVIRNNVKNAGKPVSGAPMELKDQYKGFPTSAGLPDGAARMKWNATSKMFEYNRDPLAPNLNAPEPTVYSYPAALWYYVNTPIKASNDLELEDAEAGASSWNEVITNYYDGADSEVTDNTQSVALEKPAQYGVGRLQLNIKMGDNKFFDHKGKQVDLSAGWTLKGVLIGGQNSVGYDFTSKGNENITIYDRDVVSGIVVKPNVTTTVTHTLALESKANQKVKIALELVNNGPAFVGKDGVIHTGATFYMTATLDPTTATNYSAGTLDKIFMQDHVTKVTITIKSGTKYTPGLTPDEPDPDDPDNPPHSDTDPDNPDPDPDVPNPYDDGPGGGENGDPDLTSDTVELGTSVDLEWQEGLTLEPEI